MPESGTSDTTVTRHGQAGRPRPGVRHHEAGHPNLQPEASIVDYIGILQKRRLLAIVAFLAVVVPAVPLILIAPSIYEAGARLMLEPVASTPLSFKETQAPDGNGARSFETQAETLQKPGGGAEGHRTVEAVGIVGVHGVGPGRRSPRRAPMAV